MRMTRVLAVVLRGKATVDWSPPEWAGQTGLTGYTVAVSPGDRVIDVPPTATSQVVDGLARRTSYTFTVTAVSGPHQSQPATTTLTGTGITRSLSPATIGYGTTATLRGNAYRTDTGLGQPGWRLVLMSREKGSAIWQDVAATSTGDDGSYSFSVSPSANQEFRVRYDSGNSDYLGSTSPIATATVRQSVTGSLSDSATSPGTTVAVPRVGRPRPRWPPHRAAALPRRRVADGLSGHAHRRQRLRLPDTTHRGGRLPLPRLCARPRRPRGRLQPRRATHRALTRTRYAPDVHPSCNSAPAAWGDKQREEEDVTWLSLPALAAIGVTCIVTGALLCYLANRLEGARGTNGAYPDDSTQRHHCHVTSQPQLPARIPVTSASSRSPWPGDHG